MGEKRAIKEIIIYVITIGNKWVMKEKRRSKKIYEEYSVGHRQCSL